VRLCYAELLDGRDSLHELMVTAYDPELVGQLAGFARDAMRRIQTAIGNQVGPKRGHGVTNNNNNVGDYVPLLPYPRPCCMR
jgi:hypothetical protein